MALPAGSAGLETEAYNGPPSRESRLPEHAFLRLSNCYEQSHRMQRPLEAISRGRGGRELTDEPQPTYLAPLPSLDFDGFDGFDAPFSTLSEPMSVPMSEPIPPRPTHSGAHPVKHSISDELRSVLEAWDDGSETTPATDSADSPNAATSTDTAEPAEPRKAASTRGSSASKSKTPSKRQPKASAYLNSTPSTAPRRSRKKQNTRDWLC